MREALAEKSKIELYTENSRKMFVIRGVIGYGANCIVYDAYYRDSIGLMHGVVLKELFPLNGAKENRNHGKIVWNSEDDKKQKHDGFRATYKRHLIMQQNYDFINTTCRISEDLYQANNTLYFVMEAENGRTFDKARAKNQNLYGILKNVYALSNTIGKYHEIGFLHLDVKPQNFIVIPETDELVKLFDFDSLINMDDITAGELSAISYTNEWAAPEVRQCRIKKIGPASDIYSIGAVLFYAIFGRNMDVVDRNFYDELQFDDNLLFKLVNPSIKRDLRDFFSHTLTPVVKRRYQDMEEVKCVLKRMMEKAEPGRMYLCSKTPPVYNFFCGRNEELRELHKNMVAHKLTIISGMGGMGKSELAANYVQQYEKEYGCILFIRCQKSIKELVLSQEFNIANYDDDKKEDFDKKIKTLEEVVTPSTLIVLDDISDFSDKHLHSLLTINARFIITTRCNVSNILDNGKVIQIQTMPREELHQIFIHYYGRFVSPEENEKIYEIIEWAKRYTLLIPLIAKQMDASSILPSEMLTDLKSYGIKLPKKEAVKHIKDSVLLESAMYGHIAAIFSASGISEEEKDVLRVLTLLDGLEVGKKNLAVWCGFAESRFKYRFEEDIKEDMSVINALIDKGWLLYDEIMDHVRLHDVIREWVKNEIPATRDNCVPFWSWVEDVSYLIESDFEDRTFDGEISKYECEMYGGIILIALRNLMETDENAISFIVEIIKYVHRADTLKAIQLIETLIDKNEVNLSMDSKEQLYISYTSSVCYNLQYYKTDADGSRNQEYDSIKLNRLKRAFELAEECADELNEVTKARFLLSILEAPNDLYESYSYYKYKNEEKNGGMYLYKIVHSILDKIDSANFSDYLLDKLKRYRCIFNGKCPDDEYHYDYSKPVVSNVENEAERHYDEVLNFYEECVDKRLKEDNLDYFWREIGRYFINDELSLYDKLSYLMFLYDSKIEERVVFHGPDTVTGISTCQYLLQILDYGSPVGQVNLLQVIIDYTLKTKNEGALWIYSRMFCHRCFPEKVDKGYAWITQCELHTIFYMVEYFIEQGRTDFAIYLLEYGINAFEDSFIEAAERSYNFLLFLLEKLLELATAENDSVIYYHYAHIREEQTGVRFSLDSNTSKYNGIKRDVSHIETYFGYLDRICNAESMEERRNILDEVQEDSILSNEQKVRLSSCYTLGNSFEGFCEWSLCPNLVRTPDSDIVKKCEQELKNPDISRYRKNIVICELCFQYIMLNDEEKISEYLDLYWKQVETVSAEDAQFMEIRHLCSLPLILWVQDEIPYAVEIAEKLEREWIGPRCPTMHKDDIFVSQADISNLYQILKYGSDYLLKGKPEEISIRSKAFYERIDEIQAEEDEKDEIIIRF